MKCNGLGKTHESARSFREKWLKRHAFAGVLTSAKCGGRRWAQAERLNWTELTFQIQCHRTQCFNTSKPQSRNATKPQSRNVAKPQRQQGNGNNLDIDWQVDKLNFAVILAGNMLAASQATLVYWGINCYRSFKRLVGPFGSSFFVR
ncbi:hypothetical protein AEM42_05675 [Betaproteobacteria bacterium UKL13-2]|nr:hypothetical protein AEM42_05675 [Betaproteobacteria bacterium UKL13-2]HCG53508.1 hypothetical protein [Betaproteobacteria bacterium]